MGRPSLLTPEIQRAIPAAIRAGSYDWVAAEANGVDRTTFATWMRRGEREQTEPYVTFRRDVLTARAQARLSAEIEVRRDSPFNWLRYGPGRERDDAPGWTESREVKHSGSIAIVQSEEWLRIAAALDLALQPFPEARLAVARTLQGLQTAEDEDEAIPVRSHAIRGGVSGDFDGTDDGPDEELSWPTGALVPSERGSQLPEGREP